MEHQSFEASHDNNDKITRSEIEDPKHPEIDGKNVAHPSPSCSAKTVRVRVVDWKGGENKGTSAKYMDISGEVNVEASISTDDVIRAGGFGARDDISSFLPVASDSTDFEATIRDARGYEELQEETCRPGLGWIEATKTK
ncbi:hypothetical protein CFOL_v3_03949 [Cephalotus follicularis]|uniref:Uncharacterized protein n=1 Tax=Cephalotus follicularis TaxID=3775 RepID=A0A1Q3AXI1_CEPFO|nr:hypothetical protein CFOL_v3_03949 [Cephalotus follicularis]